MERRDRESEGWGGGSALIEELAALFGAAVAG